jgi:PTH1 family peptidyl-tRNA hydrolase
VADRHFDPRAFADHAPGAATLAMIRLVVGLGNPGTKYQGTRHNIGFDLVDRLASGGAGSSFCRKFEGQVAETEIDYRRVLLLKPETFMNLSGRSVGQAVRFYKLEPTEILVICDDLSLPLGKLRLRPGGSDGGQKGLRDIAAHLGTDQFPRLRIGIGEQGSLDAVDFVLSRFRSPERATIDDALILASQAVAVWVTQGIDAAMNRFNGPIQSGQ